MVANLIRGGVMNGSTGLLDTVFSKAIRGFAKEVDPKYKIITLQLFTTWAKTDRHGNLTGKHQTETWASTKVKLQDLRKVNMMAFDKEVMFRGEKAGYRWLKQFTKSFKVKRPYR